MTLWKMIARPAAIAAVLALAAGPALAHEHGRGGEHHGKAYGYSEHRARGRHHYVPPRFRHYRPYYYRPYYRPHFRPYFYGPPYGYFHRGHAHGRHPILPAVRILRVLTHRHGYDRVYGLRYLPPPYWRGFGYRYRYGAYVAKVHGPGGVFYYVHLDPYTGTILARY